MRQGLRQRLKPQGSALQQLGTGMVKLGNGPKATCRGADTESLYAINGYNWRRHFAMAVIELAEAVARKMPSKP